MQLILYQQSLHVHIMPQESSKGRAKSKCIRWIPAEQLYCLLCQPLGATKYIYAEGGATEAYTVVVLSVRPSVCYKHFSPLAEN